MQLGLGLSLPHRRSNLPQEGRKKFSRVACLWIFQNCGVVKKWQSMSPRDVICMGDLYLFSVFRSDRARGRVIKLRHSWKVDLPNSLGVVKKGNFLTILPLFFWGILEKKQQQVDFLWLLCVFFWFGWYPSKDETSCI